MWLSNEIIEHRKKHDLNKYVPFHFIGGSPFAGAIQITYPNTDFIYITLSRKTAQTNKFKILIKHPLALENCELYKYEEGIQNIDWEQMKIRDYQNQECKNICMAECLCDRVIKYTAFHAIYCKDETSKNQVKNIITKTISNNHTLRVNIASSWFKN